MAHKRTLREQELSIPRTPQKSQLEMEAEEGARSPSEQQLDPLLPKAKRTRRVAPKDKQGKVPATPGHRSSIYRGVTRHRWTGRYEAHLWDKTCWNQSQNKKGRQVYLGAYDEEEAAARAYDLAALKYWGPGTLTNFPLTEYAKDTEEMQEVSREEYLASLRRKSSGFSRGVSKYRGVARHHHNGRWEARIGRIFGNKYLYLGTYSTQEEAAAAYDMAAIEYRGLNAVTNFDLSRYIRWLRPGQNNAAATGEDGVPAPLTPPIASETLQEAPVSSPCVEEEPSQETSQLRSLWPPPPPTDETFPFSLSANESKSTTALSLLLQSPLFKEMLQQSSSTEGFPEPDGSFGATDLDVKCEAAFHEDVGPIFGGSEGSSIVDDHTDDVFPTGGFPFLNLQSEFPYPPVSISTQEIEQGSTLLMDSVLSVPFSSLGVPYPISTCS